MALSNFCMTFILLLSFVILAYAHDDYWYDTKPELQKTKPEENQKYLLPTKLIYEQPKSEEKEKFLSTSIPKYDQPKPEEKTKLLPTKSKYEQQKPEEKVKLFPTKPYYDAQPKPEEKVKLLPTKPNYDEQPKPEDQKEMPIPTKPNYEQPSYEQPKQEEKKNSLPTKPIYEQPKPKTENILPTKPKYEQVKPEREEKLVPVKSNYQGQVPKEDKSILPSNIAVQGLVLCKSGLKYFPIQGAVAKVTCLAVHNQEGYETTSFSIKSEASDAKGYFYVTLTHAGLGDQWKLKDCKAFLDHSPLETCNVPTNVNNGVLGDLLASYSILNHSNTKLFSVGPFFYTTSSSEPKPSVPGGY
ncbi:hypothetical protein PanWU01x14_113280 [Parasponia andersonii]|uniref:Pollen Ole e 1 allergen and extensin family protein n=1 Tax=Parasponia andersonii TaxID=3476 RepID=A0A2P5CXR5_PARAD|nr:hypothetical protein PanWU01x14_113280 [Parasponia andersonii]